MKVDVLTVFPEMFDGPMNTSMLAIAQRKGLFTFRAHNLRDWTHDRHRTTDDEPYGGQSRISTETIYHPEDTEFGFGFRLYLPCRTAVALEKVEW